MNPLFQFYLLFYGALGLGLLLRTHRAWAPKLMRVTILVLEAPLFFYSYWILDLGRMRHYAPVPVISALLVLLLLPVSAVWARRLLPARPSQGSFVLAAIFSNIGTTGGAFICYLLYGTPGLALGYLYLLPYPLLVFTLGFSLAKRYASPGPLTLLDYARGLVTNSTSLIPLAAMGAGFYCNLHQVPLPAFAPVWADVFIKTDLVVMFAAIGMTLELTTLFSPARAVLALNLLKFLISPLLALALVLTAYGAALPLPAKVILIQAAMPPAIYAVITSNLFNLDRRLVNAFWVTGTLLLIPIAALLFAFFK
jgi:malate permease and related proteins